MTHRLLFAGLFATVLTAAEETPRAIQIAEPPEPLKLEGQDTVISSTRQFRINGGEPADQANHVLLAEEAKIELLRLTEERDEWKVPISVTLHGKPGDPLPARTIATKILVSEGGYRVHLDVHLGRGIDQEGFKFATTAALIFERTLRNRPTADSNTPFSVPPWLVNGLREASAWRLNQSDRRLYEALFKTGGLFKIDDLFSVDEREFAEMDGAMRAAFRVSCGSLVMALLQQPQGKGGFRALLNEVADYQGEMPALLRKHFPELNLSETSLAKWWALQLANIGGQNLTTDVFTIAETETALSEALRLNFRSPEGIIQQKELAAWPEVSALEEPDRVKSIRLAQDSLVRLSYRCFPSYRPILAEYQTILMAIARNKTQKLAEQIAALEERRGTMAAKGARARDYLNWFEITRARETSGEFEDYIRLKERLKANPHHRNDGMSKYLDRMDALFSRGIEPGNTGPIMGELPGLPPLPGP